MISSEEFGKNRDEMTRDPPAQVAGFVLPIYNIISGQPIILRFG